jgi:8-oxo-dGTP diphosphatase
MSQPNNELEAFYASLPRKRIAAGLVCRDAQNRVLLVRPTYKPTWEVPGGAVEAGEGPAVTVRRETREELGVNLTVGRLLVIDWIPERPPKTEGLMLLFDGGVVDDTVTRHFSLPEAELLEWGFVDIDELDRVVSLGMARRLRAALTALRSGSTAYLEAGLPPAE